MDDYIIDIYNQQKQKQADLERKEKTVQILSELICRHIPGSLHVIGSSATGLAAADSDLDIMLRLKDRSFNLSRTQCLQILTNMKTLLRASGQCSHILLFHRARCPILRFHFSKTRLSCDLSLHTPVSLLNTCLMTAYCKLDPRVPPFVMFSKNWAKKSEIVDPTRSFLSSYAVELMAINYLQCIASPRVLPSLQEELPKIFCAENVLKNYNRISVKPFAPMFACGANKESVGDLFGGFLRHYAELDFPNSIISVRMGKLLKLTSKGDTDVKTATNADFGHRVTFPETGLLNVEEPYSRQNVSRTVARPEALAKITDAFRSASVLLCKSRMVHI